MFQLLVGAESSLKVDFRGAGKNLRGDHLGHQISVETQLKPELTEAGCD